MAKTYRRKAHGRKVHKKTKINHKRRNIRRYHGGVSVGNENNPVFAHQGEQRRVLVPFYQELPQNEVDNQGNVQQFQPARLARDIQSQRWQDAERDLEYAIATTGSNAQIPNQIIADRIYRNVGPNPQYWLYKVVKSPNGNITHHIYLNDELYKIN